MADGRPYQPPHGCASVSGRITKRTQARRDQSGKADSELRADGRHDGKLTHPDIFADDVSVDVIDLGIGAQVQPLGYVIVETEESLNAEVRRIKAGRARCNRAGGRGFKRDIEVGKTAAHADTDKRMPVGDWFIQA